MTTPISTLTAMSEIRRLLSGEVEPELFWEFQAAAVVDFDPAKDLYVWGDEPYGNGIQFIPRYAVKLDSRETIARYNAKTWGEYWKMAGKDARFLQEEYAYKNFEEYLVDYRKEHPKEYAEMDAEEFRDTADCEYSFLNEMDGRAPDPDAKFDEGEIHRILYENNMDEDNMSKEIMNLVPKSIIDKYGEVGDGVWDGPYFYFQEKDAPAIIADLQLLGHIVIRDDFMVDIGGSGAGTQETQDYLLRRSKAYDVFEEIMKRLGSRIVGGDSCYYPKS